MDPDETLRLWREAKSPEERDEYARIIRQWVARGGFHPFWGDTDTRCRVLRLGRHK